MNESKRVINKRILCIILIAAGINLLLFCYQQMGGKNWNEFRCNETERAWILNQYSNMNLGDAQDAITKDRNAIYSSISNSKGDNLTRDAFNQVNQQQEAEENYNEEVIAHYGSLDDNEKNLFMLNLSEMQEKIQYFAGYQDSVNQVISNALKLKKFSVFSDANSFSFNNITKTAKDYQRINGLSLSLVNDKGVDNATSYYYCFYIVMALEVLIVYSLFSERENGMWCIVHGAASGRGRLAVNRLMIIGGSSFLITGLFYASTIILSLALYGGVYELLTPIQTISEYSKFTFSMSKLCYLLINGVFAWLAIWAFGVMIWMFFVICRKRNQALISVGVITGLEIIFYQSIPQQSIYSFLKQINMVRVLKVNEILQTYANVAIGCHPVSVMMVTVVALVVILVISAIVAIRGTVIMRPQEGKSIFSKIFGRVWMMYQHVFSAFTVVFKEFHKLLITGKGFVVVVVMVIVALYFAGNGRMSFTQGMKELDSIYLTQGGSEYGGIVDLINQRNQEYATAVDNLKEASEQYSQGAISQQQLISMANTVNQCAIQVKNVEEFKTKVEYLNNIKVKYAIDGYMISDRGYEEIFGQYGATREVVMLILFISAVFLIQSELFLLEYRTGMVAIVSSCKNGRSWLATRKYIAGILMCILLYCLVYGIDMGFMYKYYGMPYLNAPVMSLTFMEGCKLNVSIGMWMLLRLILRLLAGIVTMFIAFACAKMIGKSGNRAITPIVLVVILIIVIMLERVGCFL